MRHPSPCYSVQALNAVLLNAGILLVPGGHWLKLPSVHKLAAGSRTLQGPSLQ